MNSLYALINENKNITNNIFLINGNTIFLPATGRWEGDSIARKGTYGFYWSSSLDNNYAPSDASIVTVYSSELWRHEGYRGSGCVIRPVTD